MSANIEPTTTVSMTENRYLQVNNLNTMPPRLWHLWMVSAFWALGKYTEPQEYDEFLERFSRLLVQRIETGVW